MGASRRYHGDRLGAGGDLWAERARGKSHMVHHGEERRPSAPFARPRASKRRERLGALVSVAVGAPRARAASFSSVRRDGM